LLLVGAVNIILIQRSTPPFILKAVEVIIVAARAGLVVCPYSFNANSTKTVSTAGDLVGLSQHK
jgi:hypothetical protein